MTKNKDRDIIIQPNFEDMDDLVKCMPFLNLYKERGFHHLDKLTFRKRFLLDVVAFLTNLNGKVTKLKTQNCYNAEVTFDNNKIVIFIREGNHDPNRLSLFVMTNGNSNVLVKFLNEVPTDDVGDKKTLDLSYFYMSARSGMSTRDLYVNPEDFKGIYPNLYPDIDIDKLVRQYTNANEPILMLHGEPGVGKTTFVKFMIANGDFKSAAYVKDPKVMEDGEFWGELTGSNFDLIIFDDLDVDLLPRRKNTESTFMSQLLSYSDGIFTQGKVKIIVTTNQSVKEIDSALVRPGRCFDFLRLNALKKDDARKFWCETMNLSLAHFEESFKSPGDITQAALMSEIARLTSSVGLRDYVKFGNNKYTLDDKLAQLGIQTSDGESRSSNFGGNK